MGVVNSLIAAASGLLGVAVGGYFTRLNDRAQRKLAFLERRLNEFYSPMLGLHIAISTESRLRVLVIDATQTAWSEVISSGLDPKDSRQRADDFTKLIEYEDGKFIGTLLPMYKRMIAIFDEHHSLAYPDTAEHYDKLIKFVGVWDRYLDKTLPGEAVALLKHTEKDLYPLYSSLRKHHDHLVAMIASATPE